LIQRVYEGRSHEGWGIRRGALIHPDLAGNNQYPKQPETGQRFTLFQQRHFLPIIKYCIIDNWVYQAYQQTIPQSVVVNKLSSCCPHSHTTTTLAVPSFSSVAVRRADNSEEVDDVPLNTRVIGIWDISIRGLAGSAADSAVEDVSELL
jgi:hypothetical protein